MRDVAVGLLPEEGCLRAALDELEIATVPVESFPASGFHDARRDLVDTAPDCRG